MVEHAHKLVIDKKGKVKIRKPITIFVFTDIVVFVKPTKTSLDPDTITEQTELLIFSGKVTKQRAMSIIRTNERKPN